MRTSLASHISGIAAGPDPCTRAASVSECPASSIGAAWAKVADGATVLMPLDAYDFRPKSGWLQNRFGVSWQLRFPLV
jgi:predicted 3-demethylubiquinone-9 3-methyltransferase (glyoxalase superfamily)